jgi:hypothetical protein
VLSFTPWAERNKLWFDGKQGRTTLDLVVGGENYGTDGTDGTYVLGREKTKIPPGQNRKGKEKGRLGRRREYPIANSQYPMMKDEKGENVEHRTFNIQ